MRVLNWRQLLVAAAVYLVCAGAAGGEAVSSDRGNSIAPHPQLQAAIESAAASLAEDAEKNLSSFDRKVAMLRQVERLQHIAGDTSTLLRQLAYFRIHATDEDLLYASVGLMHNATLQRSEYVKAFLPYINSSGGKLNLFVRDVLREFVEDSSTPYGYYRGVLIDGVKDDRKMPWDLVRHMFRSNAGLAFIVFLDMRCAHGSKIDRKAMLGPQHTVEEALWRQRNGFIDRDLADPEAVSALVGEEKGTGVIYTHWQELAH